MPLRFYLDRRTNRYGESPIRVVWSFNGDRYQTTMGFSVPPESWDGSACRVTPAAYNHRKTPSTTINGFIESMERAVNRTENLCLRLNATLTKPLVRRIVSDVLAGGGEYPHEAEKAWARALEDRRQAGNRYFEHYLGGKYRLLGFGKDAETQEEVVVYQDLHGIGQIWVRPSQIFFGKVVDGDGNEIERYREIRL